MIFFLNYEKQTYYVIRVQHVMAVSVQYIASDVIAIITIINNSNNNNNNINTILSLSFPETFITMIDN